jgi:hypothetical protein
VVLRRADVDAYDLALAGGAHSDRDQDRHRDHPAVLSDLLEGGVQEEVSELAIEAPGAEGMDLGVELCADPADLVLGDALDAESLGEVVDRPRRDAVDVGLLDDREQSPLVPPPRLEQAREVGPRTQLGDVELDGADPRCPTPGLDIRCDGSAGSRCAHVARLQPGLSPRLPSAPGRAAARRRAGSSDPRPAPTC